MRTEWRPFLCTPRGAGCRRGEERPPFRLPVGVPLLPGRRPLLLGGAALLVMAACSDEGMPPGGLDPLASFEIDLPDGYPSGTSLRGDSLLHLRLIAAEDARGEGEEGIGPLREGLASENSELRRIAVRALGRLEDPVHLPLLEPHLRDEATLVRREAANAIAQAFQRAPADHPAVPEALEMLLERWDEEEEPRVRELLLRGVGRLPMRVDSLGGGDPKRESLLARGADPEEDPSVIFGAARGAFFLLREGGPGHRPAAELLAALEALPLFRRPAVPPLTGSDARSPSEEGDPPDSLPPSPSLAPAAPLRRAAVQARLAAAIPPSEAWLLDLSTDPDSEIRRAVLGGLLAGHRERVAAGGPEELPPEVEAVLRGGLADPDPLVRREALGALSSPAIPGGAACAPLLHGAEDPHPAVATAALARLAFPCEEANPGEVDELLGRIVASLPEERGGAWQRAGGALLAMASRNSAGTATQVRRFAGHRDPFVRMYGARAAVHDPRTGAPILERLLRDEAPWVRGTALAGWVELHGRGADGAVITVLESATDAGLIRRAAHFLEGTRAQGPAIPALLTALARLTAEGGASSRDARLALLDRMGEIGTVWQADPLRALASDADPVVAGRAVAVLAEWGDTIAATPTPRATEPPLSFARLEEWEEAPVTLRLASGDSILLRLFPFDAPYTVRRFVSLAAEGRFSGTAFHRVEPGFVVQGAGPGADEYSGHGAFTRDEIGTFGHRAGAVGISTRGRDTGDGQIFIDLVENPRLDHEYTVFARVVEGIGVVRGLGEGAEIVEIRVGIAPP